MQAQGPRPLAAETVRNLWQLKTLAEQVVLCSAGRTVGFNHAPDIGRREKCDHVFFCFSVLGIGRLIFHRDRTCRAQAAGLLAFATLRPLLGGRANSQTAQRKFLNLRQRIVLFSTSAKLLDEGILALRSQKAKGVVDRHNVFDAVGGTGVHDAHQVCGVERMDENSARRHSSLFSPNTRLIHRFSFVRKCR